MKLRKIISRKHIGLLLFTLVFVEIVIFMFVRINLDSPSSRNVSSPKDLSVFKKIWSSKIKEQGPEKSYQEMKSIYSEENRETQHLSAHLMGELLYANSGAEAIGICDHSFSFGCYHGLFAVAIGKNGLNEIHNLYEKCLERFGYKGTGCQHGIGHGLVEYLGHDEENILTALETCSTVTLKERLLGCSSGVIMEYNFPTLITDDSSTATLRQMGENPYAPCSTLPKQYRNVCYYSLPQWWDQVYRSDYDKLGQLCNDIEEQGEKRDCYLGIGGTIAANTDYNPVNTIEICSSMPSRDGHVSCRAGAAWMFYAIPETRQFYDDLCSGLTINEENTCIKDSDLAGELTDETI